MISSSKETICAPRIPIMHMVARASPTMHKHSHPIYALESFPPEELLLEASENKIHIYNEYVDKNIEQRANTKLLANNIF